MVLGNCGLEFDCSIPADTSITGPVPADRSFSGQLPTDWEFTGLVCIVGDFIGQYLLDDGAFYLNDDGGTILLE